MKYPGTHGERELTRLDRAESLRLMAGLPVGRLVFTVNALPAVRPMNFALAEDEIVVRTAADGTIARRVHDTIVAFEVDDLDRDSASGWSVTVTGRATVITDPARAAQYRALPLVPWAPGTRDQFVVITTELVEGLRISLRATPPSAADETAATAAAG